MVDVKNKGVLNVGSELNDSGVVFIESGVDFEHYDSYYAYFCIPFSEWVGNYNVCAFVSYVANKLKRNCPCVGFTAFVDYDNFCFHVFSESLPKIGSRNLKVFQKKYVDCYSYPKGSDIDFYLKYLVVSSAEKLILDCKVRGLREFKRSDYSQDKYLM